MGFQAVYGVRPVNFRCPGLVHRNLDLKAWLENLLKYHTYQYLR